MDARSLLENAYRDYWTVVDAHVVPLPCKYLPYAFDVPDIGLFYGIMGSEFTRELLNNINQLASHAHRLAIWEVTIQKLSEDAQLEIRLEFTRPLLYYALHQPYEYRSRLIFCSVQLCYQARLHNGSTKHSNFVPDHKINFQTLKELAPSWKSGPGLLDAIAAVNQQEFVDATQNYRNRSQHQIAPGLDYGHTNRIVREVTPEGHLAFSFGDAPPVTAEQALPLLSDQSQRMIAAFHGYWTLVQEHIKSIKNSAAET